MGQNSKGTAKQKDIMTVAQRSFRMSLIKGKDTQIELIIRSALHKKGYRFRKHYPNLPGRPDIVFVKSRVAVFIDGNFWHGYAFSRWKKKLKPFWKKKIQENILRDQRNFRKLRRLGWKVVRIWEQTARRDLASQIKRVEDAVKR